MWRTCTFLYSFCSLHASQFNSRPTTCTAACCSVGMVFYCWYNIRHEISGDDSSSRRSFLPNFGAGLHRPPLNARVFACLAAKDVSSQSLLPGYRIMGSGPNAQFFNVPVEVATGHPLGDHQEERKYHFRPWTRSPTSPT